MATLKATVDGRRGGTVIEFDPYGLTVRWKMSHALFEYFSDRLDAHIRGQRCGTCGAKVAESSPCTVDIQHSGFTAKNVVVMGVEGSEKDTVVRFVWCR